ncbi:uncharacterized protein LOC126355353 [Schistocerca gregaria]|uniref:uncharacterized protein LOC126355353 n=1 Tax=Schistocerca gregaria TaxID=7010 RepID=UPI00211DA9FA|nr:uncharacterized protein LOC126355353 [Schistocerca gregaria]
MSEVKFKDQILEAIGTLRRRKARPDKDRIGRYLFRHCGIPCRETYEALEQLVKQRLVIPVEYKGATSYRDPQRWSKFQWYRSAVVLKGVEDKKVFITKLHHTILDVFDELLLNQPEYFDYGIPEEEFRKYVNNFKDVRRMFGVDTLLRNGIESGLLMKLQSGNYSLALDNVSAITDPPVASEKEDKTPEKHSESVSQDIFKPSCSNYKENAPRPTTVLEPRIIVEEKSTSHSKTSSGNNEQKLFSDLDISVASRREPRIRKIKKVFDPSVISSPATKNTHLSAGNTSSAGNTVVKLLCVLCSCDTLEKLIKCCVCSKYFHRSCVLAKYGLNVMVSYWTCLFCRSCAVCFEAVDSSKMLTCTKCNKVFHNTCQIPKLTEKLSNKTWVCSCCREEGGPQPLSSTTSKKNTIGFASEGTPVNSVNNFSEQKSPFVNTLKQNAPSDRSSEQNTPSKQGCTQKSSFKGVPTQKILPRTPSGQKTSKLSIDQKVALEKSLEQKTTVIKASDQKRPLKKVSEQHTAPDSTGVSVFQNEMCKIMIHENIPDVSRWTVRRIYNYFVKKGFAAQACVFRENGIDGPTVLMLTRTDVLYNLQMKLGPALKIYHQVRILQAKAAGKSFIYYE